MIEVLGYSFVVALLGFLAVFVGWPMIARKRIAAEAAKVAERGMQQAFDQAKAETAAVMKEHDPDRSRTKQEVDDEITRIVHRGREPE